MKIERLGVSQTEDCLSQLVALLQDTVAGGASVGFLPPLSDEEAGAYWRSVVAALREPYRILLVAREAGAIVGTIQLDLASRANGSHRAEVVKLMVHSTKRRHGIGARLMQAIEAEAQRAGRTTLVLDTREGDPSERLYTGMGYVKAGSIPEYARSADGALHTTAFLYKLLEKP